MIKRENLSVPKNIPYWKAFKEIMAFFDHDKDKALKFYMMPHPHFDDMFPFEMVKSGKGQKLMQFIRRASMEYIR